MKGNAGMHCIMTPELGPGGTTRKGTPEKGGGNVVVDDVVWTGGMSKAEDST